MAEAIVNDFHDLNLDRLFEEHEYVAHYEIIKTSKGKDAILYRGFYYNWTRDNKSSTVYKCRETVNKKECPSTFTLNSSNDIVCKPHTHYPMLPIQCDIMKTRLEIEFEISKNPSVSVSKLWSKKMVELTLKHGEQDVAKHCPEFHSIEMFTNSIRLQ